MTAVYPDRESKTCIGLVSRIRGIKNPELFVNKGEIILPEILFKGLSLKLGDEVVIIATNREGAVNGVPLKVAGIIESVMGPSGKDGYLNIEDAKDILRMDELVISEIAIRVKNFGSLNDAKKEIAQTLGAAMTNPMHEKKLHDGDNAVEVSQVFEVHSWDQLAPFSTIAQMIDILIVMVRMILIAIVLISVLNIMMMSVYERTNEIGTIAALGTVPRKIMQLFLVEGIALGFMSALAGATIGVGTLFVLKISQLSFKFHAIQILLAPRIPWGEVLGTIVIVLIISVIGGFWPAHKASQMEPADALRHV
ncbi:MAG TPA: ABC transporter substrate-binding protein [Bdellovibrionales bacterium]|nr:ABC transporter substrate-binding protein [Bdellovibrionales bacterium]